jgi:hypothetical protein
MAILKGKDLSGLLGSLIIREGKNGTKIVQTKAQQYTQNKESKRTSKVFGQGSSLACEIRHQLASVTKLLNDSGMVNRFNTPIQEVLRHCCDNAEQAFTFQPDSFSRLADFEFNIKSPLINFLWVKPEMTLEDNMLKLIIPRFAIGSQFIFPRQTNTCQVTISVTQINLNQGLTKGVLTSTFEINTDQLSYPEREINFEVANECLCICGIGLAYYNRVGDTKTPYNSKMFSPGNIIAALITPGVYIEPPAPVKSHIGYTPVWTYASKLKL